MEQGRVAMCHAFGIEFKDTVDPSPPFGVYSIPEAAMVGLTERAAREQETAGEPPELVVNRGNDRIGDRVLAWDVHRVSPPWHGGLPRRE